MKREKRQKSGKRAKRTREQGLKGGKLEAAEIAGLTQVRGVYRRLMGIMG